METLAIESPNLNNKPNSPTTITSSEFIQAPLIGSSLEVEEEVEDSPIEQVRLTVSNQDDPTIPVWTFRMWFLGLLSCCLLAFLNQFFNYRSQPLVVGQITVQVASLPIGHFMATVLPKTQFGIPGFGKRVFSLNPGPFNIKEHVLITILANAGGSPLGVSIVDIIIAFYRRNISFVTGWLLIITTQVLGYGWAGILRKYVVEPAHMWWPSTLVQVSLFRALHEKEDRRMSRQKFFMIALVCSFVWYLLPGYLFTTLTSMAWVCWAFPKSVTAQQMGSGLKGLGIGALTFDWSTVASYLGSPLITPFFSIVNVLVGYALLIYIVVPISYWGFDLFDARKFPIFSSDLFTTKGHVYDILAIVNDDFELDPIKYAEQGQVHLSTLFAVTYGFGFAAITSTITHVTLFYGREIYEKFSASYKEKEDIHTKLMRKYEDIPSWWFHVLLVVTLVVSLIMCIALNDEVQLPWWGLIFGAGIAFIFTLPTSILSATTNMAPALNGVTDYIMGLIYPGRPIANVCFKVYGIVSVNQAVSFLSDFKLGHYMKIPPRSMFLVQFVGTILAGTINMTVAWWMLHSIENICQPSLLPPGSPWTCPFDRVFFDQSVIWGLVGPRRIFGSKGSYGTINWFFLGGALAPIIVWLFHKAFPKKTWIPLVNFPVLLGATVAIPPATPLNYNAWIIVGIIFNYFLFRYRKNWWQRYNYILSAALNAGVAFMAVLLYLTLGIEDKGVSWWGTQGEHCPLASCPTGKGIAVDGCPMH